MELKVSSDGISRALYVEEEQNCWYCKAKISFGNSVWVCSKTNLLTCKKCTFKKAYSCPTKASHEDIKATLMRMPKVQE